MMYRMVVVLGIAAAAGLTGCAPRTPAARTPVAAAPAARPAAADGTRNCVELRDIREAKVVDDRTIDFVLSNRQVLRNRLPNACPQLGFQRAFTYATSLSRLCSVDIITVIITGGGPRTGASCGLGQFVPYTPIPAK